MTPNDVRDLRLLEIGHYVYAGVSLLLVLFPAGIVAMMWMLWPRFQAAPQPPPELFLYIFTGAVLFMALMGLATSGVSFLAGRWIAQRRRRMWCVVVAAVNCLNLPFGTALGILTILILHRDSVRSAYSD